MRNFILAAFAALTLTFAVAPMAQADTGKLLQGTLDMLVLKSLQLGAMHGWGITERIEQGSGRAFLINQGSLYPALYRLERQGLVPRQVPRAGMAQHIAGREMLAQIHRQIEPMRLELGFERGKVVRGQRALPQLRAGVEKGELDEGIDRRFHRCEGSRGRNSRHHGSLYFD